MWETKYLCKPITSNEHEYLWYKLCVYYHAKTELFDRTLTDLRSPYDSTEAWVAIPNLQCYSRTYARKVNRFIREAAIRLDIPKEYVQSIGLKANTYRYSAQRWIDEYNRLVSDGEMDFINELQIDPLFEEMERGKDIHDDNKPIYLGDEAIAWRHLSLKT